MATPRNLSPAAEALVDAIRAGDPAAIAPEVYGLEKTMARSPASLVLELIGTSPQEVFNELRQVPFQEKSLSLEAVTPREGETMAAWVRRMDQFGCVDFNEPRYSDTAYAAIGYDWVEWKWLPKGQNTHTRAREIAVDDGDSVRAHGIVP